MNEGVSPELLIRCERTGATLKIGFDSASDGDAFLAEVNSEGLQATVPAYSDGGEGFAEFWRSIAKSWRGWDGERVWQSLEGQLTLSCCHDHVAHVSVSVLLRFLGRDDWQWTTQTTIQVALGDLERIASAAEKMVDKRGKP